MSEFTDTHEEGLLKLSLGKAATDIAATPAITQIRVELCSAAVLEDGTTTVITALDTPVVNTVPTDWTAPAQNAASPTQAESSNVAPISFGNATGALTATHVRIKDQLDVVRAFTPLDSAKTAASGDPVSFPAGALKVRIG